MRGKVDELWIFLKLCWFDVFGVIEMYLIIEIVDEEINIEDYNCICRDRLGRWGGGCVIYYCELLKVIYWLDLEDDKVEGIFL